MENSDGNGGLVMAQLSLHPRPANTLVNHYERAFKSATELFILSAYLTEWPHSFVINERCEQFRLIVGKDFGITRKAACRTVLEWLPPERSAEFLVAELIDGFHPKAVFWKEATGDSFAIIGSSNLTRSAFGTNYEANVFMELSEANFAEARRWVCDVYEKSVPVTEDWLAQYNEANPAKGPKQPPRRATPNSTSSAIALPLPLPKGTNERLIDRRKSIIEFGKRREEILALFRRCSDGSISDEYFYLQLNQLWNHDPIGDRLQGKGWEIKGKHSDFNILSRSLISIVDAAEYKRDDVVRTQIDLLSKADIPTRGAFLSEMLCLLFQDRYPLLNGPVRNFLAGVKYRHRNKSSEGARYLHVAKALRSSLQKNPNHPAKNLAELDAVIQQEWR